jgi:hypothetical protein
MEFTLVNGHTKGPHALYLVGDHRPTSLLASGVVGCPQDLLFQQKKCVYIYLYVYLHIPTFVHSYIRTFDTGRNKEPLEMYRLIA